MKKGFLTLFLLSFTAALFAQQSAKRYVMIEHFTNSRCSVCASKNPSFYNFINQYPNDIHHISIHPSMPYNNCFFYLANPIENNERAYFYNIIGTPSIALNGTLLNPSTPLLNSTKLQPYLNQTSPIYLKVTETGTGNTRSGSIDVHSLGALPNGSYKLYAAIVEKTVNYNAPNGETVHHDVFRKIVPEINGIAFTPAPVGQSNVINFSYAIANNWVADEVYILAYVQSSAPEIINSGTKYDPLVLSASDAKVETIAVMPNPATDQVYFQLPDEQVQSLEIFDVKGQRLAANFSQEQEVVQVPVAQLAPGMYFFKITGSQKVYTAKLIKE